MTFSLKKVTAPWGSPRRLSHRKREDQLFRDRAPAFFLVRPSLDRRLFVVAAA
jgi:hypothetical protein